MDSAKNQLVEKLKSANNILVTVSRNPSVDQLAACIGLTLLLNKLNKHATAVFSGEVPSTIEFLQPDETIEKNTDSLRDFIIALDKSKADKLRYKVEDETVRIFITPYKTSISQSDLEFSQGDFNVDVVVALGVLRQEDLDQAITSHGRILHDATVATINTEIGGEEGLGSINWSDQQASSLSELVADLARDLGQNLLDGQLATALLTGIVAETERFSNEKTKSQTMSVSAELMAAGANQQLVATKLEEAEVQPSSKTNSSDGGDADAGQPASADGSDSPKLDDGTLEIEHGSEDEKLDSDAKDGDEPASSSSNDLSDSDKPDSDVALPGVDTSGRASMLGPARNLDFPSALPPVDPQEPTAGAPSIATENGTLMVHTNTPSDAPKTAEDLLSLPPVEESSLPPSAPPEVASIPEPATLPIPVEPPSDTTTTDSTPQQPVWTPPPEPVLNLDVTPPTTADSTTADATALTPTTDEVGAKDNDTLTEIEEAVHSPHVEAADVDSARDEVERALNSSESTPVVPTPIEALNAHPLGEELHPASSPPPVPTTSFADTLQQTIPQVPSSLPGLSTVPATTPDPINVIPPSLADSPAALSTDQKPVPDMTHSFSQPAPFVAPPEETEGAVTDPDAPPPVPPPIPFRFGSPTTSPPQSAV